MVLQIRPFAESDTRSLHSICCQTVAERPFLPWIDEPRLACDFFLDPYLELERESCFVAELDGQIVGYLVGTREAKRFWLREKAFLRQRLRQLMQVHLAAAVRNRVHHLLTHAVLAKIYWKVLSGRLHERSSSNHLDIRRFPAECHLQVVPEARGRYVGLALMLKFHEYLKAEGIQGHHCIVTEEAGREAFSRMMLALRYRLVHERQFTSRDVRTLVHPGTWQERILVREL